ncbi:Alpha-ketoglutarate-dependent dioxygenase alkB 2 [Branchiostoma belcheri]|nr:Alpha-ketoglutarate-dependent dioxygenase alkB 2 [Branchiostoma belcheri]
MPPRGTICCRGTFATERRFPRSKVLSSRRLEAVLLERGNLLSVAKVPRQQIVPRGGILLASLTEKITPTPNKTAKEARPRPRGPAALPGPVESQRGHFKPFSRVPGGRVGRYYLLRKLRGENFNCDYTVLYRPSVASTLFQACEEEFVYNTGDLAQVQIFGKYRDIPRKQVAFGDPGLSYRFSGVEIPARPWSPLLRTIKDRIQEVTGQEFNFVLINRYKDGLDYIGEHRDDEEGLVQNAPIASLSLGQKRDFIFKHCDARGKYKKRSEVSHKTVTERATSFLRRSPTMPHECDVCGREFSRKANLARHRDTIHGDVAEISSGEESMDTEPGSYRSVDIFDDTDDLSEEATTEHDTESLESYEECEVSEEDESVADSQEVESATETDSDQSGSESDASSIVSSSPAPSDESDEYGYDSGDEEEWTLYRDWTIPLTHDPGDVPQRVIKETRRAGKMFYLVEFAALPPPYSYEIIHSKNWVSEQTLMKKYGFLVLK